MPKLDHRRVDAIYEKRTDKPAHSELGRDRGESVESKRADPHPNPPPFFGEGARSFRGAVITAPYTHTPAHSRSRRST
jgi:hypothetical protein